MSTAGITFEEWLARYGVPLTFRDDGKPLHARWDLRGATPDEMRLSGYTTPMTDAVYARLSRLHADGTIKAVIVPVAADAPVETIADAVAGFNAAPDEFFDLMWTCLTACGAHVFFVPNP